MTTYKQIRASIRELLSTSFNADFNSNDVKEGFMRPSFFMRFDNPTSTSYLHETVRTTTVRINYFPTDRHEYSIELMDVQEKLERLLDLKLRVINRLLNIDELSFEETDGVLICSFDLAFSEAKEVSFEDEYRYVDEEGNPLLDENEIPITIENMQDLKMRKV